jgi:hypothetical protein
MANIDNLVKGDEIHKFTPEEASKGGKKSAEVRRKKKELREVIELLLEKEYQDKKSGTTKSGAELIAFKQFQKALEGDTRAFEVIRDTAGQKPVEKVMVAEVDNDVISEIENMVLNDD